jgi:hypothetical protein
MLGYSCGIDGGEPGYWFGQALFNAPEPQTSSIPDSTSFFTIPISEPGKPVNLTNTPNNSDGFMPLN